MRARCVSISRRRIARYPSTISTAASVLRRAFSPGRARRVELTRFPRASEEIDDREENDPHQVHEVPVEADRLDPLVALLRVLAEKGLAGHEGHADDAAEDVEAVEAGRREEHGAEEGDVRVEPLVQQLPVLDDLHGE